MLVCKGFSKFDTRQTQTINSMKTVHVQMPSTLKSYKSFKENVLEQCKCCSS